MYKGKIIDPHLHIRGGFDDTNGIVSGMEQMRKELHYSQYAMMSLPAFEEECIGQNIICAFQKLQYEENTYAFGGLEYYFPEGSERPPFNVQAKELMAMGFDGIKMIETKPYVRKKIGNLSINGPEYEDFFAYVQENDIPILLHVADPETFWSEDTAPAWAKENGWFYADKSFASKEQLYQEAECVFAKYPQIRFCLAHFYFLSNDLERAAKILDSFKNVSFDITPGTEMYGNFAKRPKEWRAFFTKYADRIIFGTDNGWGTELSMEEKIKAAKYNNNAIHRFLETDEKFVAHDLQFVGIALGEETLEKIYYSNAKAFLGKKKRIDPALLLTYAEKWLKIYEQSPDEDTKKAYRQVHEVAKCLRNQIH